MINLRPYQKDCVEAIERDLVGNDKLGAILSTGSGKTVIFIEVVKRYLDKNPDKRVLVLSDSSILTAQNKARFNQFYPELKVGILQASMVPSKSDQVVIATVQSTRIQSKVKSWLGIYEHTVGLVVIDEAHCLMTKSYDTALGYFKDAKQIGFTASPYRDRQLMVSYFDKVSYTISMQELIGQKYLVPIEMIQIVKKRDPVAQTVELYKRNELGSKAGIFFNTTEEAKLARNLFEKEGIRAEIILGTTKWKTRDKLISEFNDGELNILCTCNVLSAGFDAPKLECIIMPYGTRSPTLFLQRTGRGSRPQDKESVKPEHHKQSCRVYMFGSAPSIKRGLYKKLEHFVLNDGSEKEPMDIHDDLEVMV
jgi:superfamily II DNA or RNA helicase